MVSGNISLRPEEITLIPPDVAEPLLAYLNMPPVGCYADTAGPINLNSERAYEVQAGARLALIERRTRLQGGKFSSLGDLQSIPGFGPPQLAEILQTLSDLRRHGQRLRAVWGGPEAEREFFALLEGAQRYIHISTYIVGGEAGMRMARLLARKLREGIQVRLLFCASGLVISGSPSGTGFVSRLSETRSYLLNDRYVRKRILQELRASGVPFINSAPIGRHWKRRDLRASGVRTAFDYYRWARQRGVPDAWLDEQERIDAECGLSFANVDHRKMVIVDGEKAFIGSQNIADSYFYKNELADDPRVNVRRWQWHDNSAILEGGSVVDLNRLFAQRWALSGGDLFDPEDTFYAPPPRRRGNAAVAIQTSIPGMLRIPLQRNLPRLLASMLGANLHPQTEGENPIRDRMLQLPQLARESLYVEHCYPSDVGLLQSWMAYVSRIPEFVVVVPLHYDTTLLGYECDRFFGDLLTGGMKVTGYDRAIMHSKIAVADGWYVATGSYNLTLRSARSDLELEFFIQCPEYGAAVRDHIRQDLADCRPIVPTRLDRFRARRSVPVLDALVRYLLL